MYSEQTFRHRYTLCAEVWVWVDGFTGEQLVGVTQINLASALLLATTSSEEDMALGQVPVWCAEAERPPPAQSCILSPRRQEQREAIIDTWQGTQLSPLDAASCASRVVVDVDVQHLELEESQAQAIGRRHDRYAHLRGIGHQVPHLLIRAIGHSAYGLEIAAIDQTTGNSVAIKTIPKTSDDLVDAKRIVREICLMRHLAPHIVQVLDYSCTCGRRGSPSLKTRTS
ncbi:hypothetical protein AeRB84_020259 [Aphanomyces euteiches]|nr:hypothetical protein AeRB84_020259 [Aphanomyces euteiches]